jgi:threonine dehydratase
VTDTSENCPVSLIESIRARAVVTRFLRPTALRHYEGISRVLGAEIHVKHENHNPTGSFKIRGGVNLMHHLAARDTAGVITFSTGNHGLSIATAAAWMGIPAVIVVPEGSNPAKTRAIRETGAELVEAGSTFEAAGAVVEELSEARGLYYAHPANEPHLINGVGTEFLEVLEELPDVDAVVLPIGAGSEVAAAVTVLLSVRPEIEIYAVQASSSPAAYLSWKSGGIVSAVNATFAGGFATGQAYELPFSIYKDKLAGFVTLSESELHSGIAAGFFHTHNLAEGAGASTLMAAAALRDQLRGKRVVLQMSGCNASPEEIARAVDCPEFTAGLI